MKIIKYLICLLWIGLVSSHSFAYRGAIVAFFRSPYSNTRAYNPLLMYPGGRIKYYISPSLRNFQIRLDGNTYHVNMEPIIQNAMQAWHQRNHRLLFEPVENPAQANYVAIIAADTIGDPMAANGIPREPGIHEQACLSFFQGGIARTIALLRIADLRASEYPEITEVFDIVLKYMAERIIANTLGLANHPAPSPDDLPDLEPDFFPFLNPRIFRMDQVSDRPHLMTPSISAFLQELRADLGGRAPRVGDIGAAPEEVTALRIVTDNLPESPEVFCEACDAASCKARGSTRSAISNASRACMRAIDPAALPAINSLLL